MKKIKNILLLAILVLAFSSCKKCKECSGYMDDGVYEPMLEVCSDDFESKKDFNNYIKVKEAQGYECKSDFWN